MKILKIENMIMPTRPAWRALALLSLVCTIRVLALDGTFTVTESWSATLTYTNWGGQFYAGTQHFSGTQTGAIVVSNNNYTLIDQTGVPNTPPGGPPKRTIQFDGSQYTMGGGKVMPYILAGVNLYGVLYLNGFMVRVPLVDGEIPTFNKYTPFIASGPNLSTLSASGDMEGFDLTIDVTSTSSWTLVSAPPAVTSDPVNAVVSAGGTARFSVTAIGSAPLLYQWQVWPPTATGWSTLGDGGDYSGVTTPTLTITGVTTNLNGDQFRCVVSNTRGSSASGAGILMVGSAPVITAQPQDQSVIEGQAATFVVTATASPTSTYQWQSEPAGTGSWLNLSGGGNYSGVTTAVLTVVKPPLTSSGDAYRCLVSNNFGTTTSSVATLTVFPPVLAPTITAQPKSQTLRGGTSVTFAVSVSGTPPLMYQWWKDNSIILNATNVTYTIAAALPADAGSYYVVVSNGAGSVSSSIAVLTLTNAYTFVTLAGSPKVGSADGVGSQARFNSPWGTAVDASGNVYVADEGNHTIRKISPQAVVSTLAGLAGTSGSADGIGSAARFSSPRGVAVDRLGSIFVADWGNSTIRVITPSGVVSTLAGRPDFFGSADGVGTNAMFNSPAAVAVDAFGNVYVSDSANTIRKIAPNGLVSTIAGLAGSKGSADGAGSEARFNQPAGLAVDTMGNIYVADSANNTIRKITMAGLVSTIGGVAQDTNSDGLNDGGYADGAPGVSQFFFPLGIAVDNAGNTYVADHAGTVIRKISSLNIASTIAGSPIMGGEVDGIGAIARFSGVSGLTVDTEGNLYAADWQMSNIRKIEASGLVSTLAGQVDSQGSADGAAGETRFHDPEGIAIDAVGSLYLADSQNCTIRKITPNGLVSTLAGLAGNRGSRDGVGAAALFNAPEGLAVDSTGIIYIADSWNHTIRKLDTNGLVSTLAGRVGSSGSTDGPGNLARFNVPWSLAAANGGILYVADSYNNTIRKITADGLVTTVAGLAGSPGSADGPGSVARFNQPTGVVVGGDGSVYVADYGNNTIRIIGPNGSVTTLAGSAGAFFPYGQDGPGNAARFRNPSGVAVDRTGNVYVADQNDSLIRLISPSGMVTTLGGLAVSPGYADGTGSTARFDFPASIAIDAQGTIYVAEPSNNVIRKGIADYGQPIVIGQPQSQTVDDGSNVVFSVRVVGMVPLQYQWQKDGRLLPGNTNATLSISAATPGDAGVYVVVVTNRIGTATSQPATLRVLTGCFANLPAPQPRITGLQQAQNGLGNPYTYYFLEVVNRSSFPEALFKPAPDLPPCGLNTNSSRTWVNILDEKNSHLNGFCGLQSSEELANLWFAVLSNQPIPTRVYITLEDRQCGLTYQSDFIPIPPMLSAKWVPARGLQLTISGPPGQQLEIQSSANLLGWTELAHLTNTVGASTYTDTSASALSQSFYRLRVIP